MNEPRWVGRTALVFLHSETLAEHGGVRGFRDEGLLDSALHRPKKGFHYEDDTDIVELAAAYGTGIVRNHPFVDGNKRVAFLAVGLFLGLNGCELRADKAEATAVVAGLAAGDLSEDEFAGWLRPRISRIVY